MPTPPDRASKWRKSSPDLVARFATVLPADPRVVRRSMFGYPCAFVHGHMFAGLHEERLFVRLAATDRAELLAHRGAHRFEPVPGRVMKEYVVVPAAMHGDPGALTTWVAAAFSYVAGLPPKPDRRRAAAPAPTPAPAARRRRGR